MSRRNPPLYCILILLSIAMYAMMMHEHHDRDKDTTSLGTAQLCYVGSRIGSVLALKAGALTVDWRDKTESTIMFMVLRKVLTGRG